MPNRHFQYCADGFDIGGSLHAYDDATEIRTWGESGDLIASVALGTDGMWSDPTGTVTFATKLEAQRWLNNQR